MRLAEPGRSRAILVGTAHYENENLPDILPVQGNVEDLAAILTDPGLAGFLPGNVHTIIDPRANAGREIARWCRAAEDVLLVYFAGHGLVDNKGQLLLAMSDTEKDLEEHSSLPIGQLRSAIAASPAQIRILILDCCFSGRALAETMSGEGSRLLGQIDVKGTYTLASAERSMASLFIPGERHTVFTGELIRLLREGVASHSPLLALPTVYHQLTRRLRERECPTPKVLHTDTVSEFALVRNKGYRPGETVAPQQTSTAVRLRTPAQADELARRLARTIQPLMRPPLFTQNRDCVNALNELSAAAIDPGWPVLARLRFVWLLADFGETDRAAAALYALGAAYNPTAVDNVTSFLSELADDDDWSRRTMHAWSIDDLGPRHRIAAGFDPKDLWGTAMAMLLAEAGLPTSVRVQAVTELAGLGHRDEAVRIARGMLRERHPDPGLTTAVAEFLG